MTTLTMSDKQLKVIDEMVLKGRKNCAWIVSSLDDQLIWLSEHTGTKDGKVSHENFYQIDRLVRIILDVERLNGGFINDHRIRLMSEGDSVKDWIAERRNAVQEDFPSFVILGGEGSHLMSIFKEIFPDVQFICEKSEEK